MQNAFVKCIFILHLSFCSFGENNCAKLNFSQIAVNLRLKRFEGGALQLNQVKLQFILNKETGLPSGYSVFEQKDSNR